MQAVSVKKEECWNNESEDDTFAFPVRCQSQQQSNSNIWRSAHRRSLRMRTHYSTDGRNAQLATGYLIF